MASTVYETEISVGKERETRRVATVPEHHGHGDPRGTPGEEQEGIKCHVLSYLVGILKNLEGKLSIGKCTF